MNTPIKIIDQDIAYLEIYDNFIISSIKEDIVFGLEELNWFLQVFEEYFPNKKFGYIGDRVFNYNIKPDTYFISSQHEGLSAMAIICYNELGKQTALFEKEFFKKPFSVFDNLEDAKKWIFKNL
jgi:hypothetical protein